MIGMTGRTVLVAGAGSGIGAHSALPTAGSSATTILLDRDMPALRETEGAATTWAASAWRSPKSRRCPAIFTRRCVMNARSATD
jgi:NAD(P)-dependent dehydrogenase (short-subunit alcohol dehydrogenase family)